MKNILLRHEELRHRLSTRRSRLRNPHAAAERALPRAFLLLLLASLLYWIVNDLRATEYRHFVSLTWSELAGFRSAELPPQADVPYAAVGSIALGEGRHSRRLLTEPFIMEPNEGVRLEFLAGPAESTCHLDISFLDSSKRLLHRITLVPDNAAWRSISVELPRGVAAEQQVQLRAEQSASDECYSALRSRLEVVGISTFIEIQQFFRSSFFGVLFLCLGFAAIVLAGVMACFKAAGGTLAWLSIFLLLSLGTHLRLSGYYFWDEWTALERYAREGPSSVLRTHNEHFLPLFFAWYSELARAFRGAYLPLLIISCGMHSLVGAFIYKLLQRYGAQQSTAGLLSSLFIVSSLHGESLQWAFEQSLLICHLLLFSSIYCGLRFVDVGSKRFAVLALVLGGISPLFFGNGFVLGGYWPLLSGFAVLQTARYRRKESFVRASAVWFLLLLLLGACAVLYSQFRSGDGHTMEQARLFENLWEVGNYLFVGSQLGTVLRGMGLVPSVELGVAPHLLEPLRTLLPVPAWRPELVVAWIGAGLSILILVLSSVVDRKAWQYWLCGQAFILGSLALPALGRWHFGLEQSLSLRYHYGSLFGLLVMLLPGFQWLFAGQRADRLRGRIAVVGMFLWLNVQLWTAMQFTYFQDQGQRHRHFIAALLDWRETIGEETPWKAAGTEFEGMQPSYPQTITPGKHPNDIYYVMRWLQHGERDTKVP